jgi:hypothetical protein
MTSGNEKAETREEILQRIAENRVRILEALGIEVPAILKGQRNESA